MSTSIPIKLTVSPVEAQEIDKAVEQGQGSCRADVCRKAIILYIDQQQRKVEA